MIMMVIIMIMLIVIMMGMMIMLMMVMLMKVMMVMLMMVMMMIVMMMVILMMMVVILMLLYKCAGSGIQGQCFPSFFSPAPQSYFAVNLYTLRAKPHTQMVGAILVGLSVDSLCCTSLLEGEQGPLTH